MMDFPKLFVTDKAADSLRGGHPWVYAAEVTKTEGTPTRGDFVHVYSAKGKYLGTGFYNDLSKIAVRVISKNPNDTFDDAFFARRLSHAVAYRRAVMGDDFSACRLIFGEADYFPGLTVDRFGDVLVTEILCYGIDKRKEMLLSTLVRILREAGEEIRVVYDRSDSEIRTLEGLEKHTGFFDFDGLVADDAGVTTITENGILYTVDYINGQKTGFFLDQKYNRMAIRNIARGRRVLDCFTHTGSFGLNAAAGGAAHVTSVDISADAITVAKGNAKQNGFADRIDYVTADCFDYLAACESRGGSPYDFIILDPPAFTKSRDTLKNAIKGYREINSLAMKILPRGGYLATCSCSHFMTETYFKQMLHNAAEDAGVTLKQIEARAQSPDHPILWNVPETSYLKFYIFQIV